MDFAYIHPMINKQYTPNIKQSYPANFKLQIESHSDRIVYSAHVQTDVGNWEIYDREVSLHINHSEPAIFIQQAIDRITQDLFAQLSHKQVQERIVGKDKGVKVREGVKEILYQISEDEDIDKSLAQELLQDILDEE